MMCGKFHVRRGRYEGSLIRDDLRTLFPEEVKDMVERHTKWNRHVIHIYNVSDYKCRQHTAKQRDKEITGPHVAIVVLFKKWQKRKTKL
jgi:hypothetical protein